jgi:hypothetical protein
MPEANWPKIMLFRRITAMQLHSLRTFRPSPSAMEPIPYSAESLRQDLQRVRNAWADCQATRDRDAIYAYLSAVYALVAWWTAEGQEIDRAHRALRLQRLKPSDREDSFAAVMRCTADPAKADNRTRSKWSRLMRYAAMYKPDSEPLEQFIKRKGGINECAARFTRDRRRGNIERDPVVRSASVGKKWKVLAR